MIDPAILHSLEALRLPEPPPMVMERVHRDALGEEFHRIGTQMADTFDAEAEYYIKAMASAQEQYGRGMPAGLASPEELAEFTRAIEAHEAAAEIRAKRAAKARKLSERQAKAEMARSPSLAVARRQIARRVIATDKRLTDALLTYALFIRALRAELDPASQDAPTYSDTASLHDHLARLGAV